MYSNKSKRFSNEIKIFVLFLAILFCFILVLVKYQQANEYKNILISHRGVTNILKIRCLLSNGLLKMAIGL